MISFKKFYAEPITMSSVSYRVGHFQPTWNHELKLKNLPISVSLNYTNNNCLMFVSPEGCLKQYSAFLKQISSPLQHINLSWIGPLTILFLADQDSKASFVIITPLAPIPISSNSSMIKQWHTDGHTPVHVLWDLTSTNNVPIVSDLKPGSRR